MTTIKKLVNLSIIPPAIACLAMLALAGCSSTGRKAAGAVAAVPDQDLAADISQRWGVTVESLRLSAHGHLLDLRYRVLNADKAKALADPQSQAFLIHEATGIRLKVPSMPKVGALRSTSTRLAPGAIYVMLFANQGQVVKASDLVTLEIGKGRIEHLKVQ